jgi:spermidine/putrescine transport system substrate-binding protein
MMSKFKDNDMSQTTRLSRREAARLGLGAAALGLGLRTMTARAAADTITYYGYGGIAQKAMQEVGLAPFSEKTGIKIVEGTFGDETEVVTRIKSGGAGDLNVFANSGFDTYKRYIDLGANSELNEQNIPNLKLVSKVLLEQLRALTPNRTLSGVPYNYGTTGIGYNTKHISEQEAKSLGFKLLFDERFKGKMALSGNAQERIWSAAVFTGQNPNDIEDLDKVWEALRAQRELVKKYWESGAESMDLLAKEEVVVADIWSTRATALKKQGYPIAYLEPEQCLAWMQNLFVMKGSPMTECEQLINFLLQPEVNFGYCQRTNNGSSLDPREVEFPEDLKDQPGYDPTGTFAGFAIPDAIYWSENIDKLEAQWGRIAKGA